ncbi:MAG: 4Fe-4S binding protein, partial [Deltaproteobacteria bacterium]
MKKTLQRNPMRKTIQALSLLLFTISFALATYRLPDWFPADLYLRIDPLLGLSALIASREMIGRVLWSLILIGATLAVGRFFCGYVCPLGVAIDGFDFLLFRKLKRAILPNDASLRRWKYALLILFFAAAVTGVSLVYFLDPIALLTRFFTFLLYPLLMTIINMLLDLLRPLFQGLGWASLSHLYYPQPVFYMTAVTLLIFGVVIGLNRLAPRFWCRYLCPLGALLSLISPLGIFRRRVSQACNRCMVCRKNCPQGAIGEDPLNTSYGDCIQCRECAGICPKQAISFPASFSGMGEYSGLDLSRRGFVSSVGGGLTLGFLSLRTPFIPLQGRQQLIRPPGALPETEFLRTCIRCGECMKSCITN